MTEKQHILDVRTKLEYLIGHRKGAHYFNLDRLIAGELPNIPKDTPVGVYCASGNRSEVAKQLLLKQGFSDVTNLGGYPE
jgi:phage shock protein E